jgi:hypothetical protein
MSDQKFTGEVVRVEADGFGVVKFDDKIGANTHGIFSTTISSRLPLVRLKPGVKVSGTVEVDHRDLAAVRTLSVD